MKSFFIKLAMLVFFILATVFIWAALFMVFPVSLINIILGIVGAFFLLRAFEFADKVNKLGPYSEESVEEDNRPRPHPQNHNHDYYRYGESEPTDEEDINHDLDIPDEG